MSENQLVVQLNKNESTLWDVRASYLSEGQKTYFKRALLNIMENKQLAKMAQNENGAKQIIMCISKAIQMGLQIGGQIPQAYIVPMPSNQGDLAVLVPTMTGYRFIAKSEPAIIKDIKVRAVYEKEVENKNFRIDIGAGKVFGHEVYLGLDRGNIIGCYGIITELDDSSTVEWMPIKDIHNIRDNHSKSWRAVQAGKMNKDKCAWVTDNDMQCIKTAGKRFLKPYASDKEGLMMALAVEDEEVDDRPIDKRTESILDNVIETDATVEVIDETEKETEIKIEEKPPEEKDENQSNFPGFGSEKGDKF